MHLKKPLGMIINALYLCLSYFGDQENFGYAQEIVHGRATPARGYTSRSARATRGSQVRVCLGRRGSSVMMHWSVNVCPFSWNRIELWLKNWEFKRNRRAEERAEKCKRALEHPETPEELFLQKQLKIRIQKHIKVGTHTFSCCGFCRSNAVTTVIYCLVLGCVAASRQAENPDGDPRGPRPRRD
jgi:hypothetical protein